MNDGGRGFPALSERHDRARVEGSLDGQAAVDTLMATGHPAVVHGRAAAPRRIWIDLDNTPHVPFFLPIIRELEREGHSVVVTARDAFQVCGLADHHGLAYTTVGRHYGANKTMKVAGTVWRAAQLLPLVLREKPDISMSHGSRPLVLVSALLRIPACCCSTTSMRNVSRS